MPSSHKLHDATSRNSRAEKLLRLALDCAASDGEIVGACRALQRMARESGSDPLSLVLARPDCPDAQIPFGKHRGQLLSVVFRDDPDYLEWLCANIRPRGRRFAEALEFWSAQLEEAA